MIKLLNFFAPTNEQPIPQTEDLSTAQQEIEDLPQDRYLIVSGGPQVQNNPEG